MPASRQSPPTAAPAGPASRELARASDEPARVQEDSATAEDVAELIRLSAAANAALLRGDVDAYRALVALADDFTLMSPFGGPATRGADMTDERWQAMRRFFRNGTLELELVQSYAAADMVVLAVVERCRGEVGGLPAQEWPLRVTLVYRRQGTGWRLAHRHADPLAAGIGLGHAAALARGEAR